MDDFILGYIEGGLEYDHNYDHDLHRDLELELGNNHDDGPFAALADEVDLLPHYDHDDYHIEYYARSDQGGGFAGVNLDERSVDPEGSGGLQYRHRYESSVSESIGAPSSSDSGSEDVHQHHYHISDDDSEEEEEEQVRGHYGIPFPGRRHISDDESEESDDGSLPSFDVDQVHDYSENEQAEDSSPDEGDYQTSEDDEVHPPSVQWDPLAEVAALSDDEILADLEAIHEIDVFSEDQDSDDSSDDEALARHYDVELSSSSEEQRSNNQYDDNDDDEDQASAANSRRSTSSTSPSEGSIALPSHHRAFLAHHPRGFDALRDLDNLQRERQRLQEDLRQLRDAHFGIPHPVRRANVPNGVDYLLDRLPAPQRDAHGLIAQMEMDLERGRQQRRRAAPSPIRAPPRTQQQQQQPQQREPAFIDLTGDSESPPPEVLALPDAPRFAGRDANPFTPRDQTRSNPRRNNPVRRAPSFARSDGSFLGPGGAPIIDLTNDAPEADLPARLGTPRRRREVQNNDGLVDRVRANAWGAANMNAIFRQMGIPRVGADFLQHMRVALGGGQVDYEVEFIGENIRPDHNHMNGPLANFPIMENPLADNPVDFNYGANGLNQEAARPKPAHIAPPEPREGFTRSTGEDTVVICPSCEEELKYDPDEKGAQPPPAKKVRTTKKDREEHHFWAVKACGHVYCRSCFENRRPTTRNAGMAHFQVVDKRILCAVDECSSDVSTKTAWVGIFL